MVKLIKKNVDGTQQEYLGADASNGAPDAGEFVKLNAAGKLDETMMPDGVGADQLSMVASEAVTAGDYLYITASGEVAKADASIIAKKAVCFATESVAAMSPVKVKFDDTNTFVAGLTPGVVYFLSDATAGDVTDTAPTTAGSIVQQVGVALNATTIHSDIAAVPVIRA